jgi:hypothetical protein
MLENISISGTYFYALYFMLISIYLFPSSEKTFNVFISYSIRYCNREKTTLPDLLVIGEGQQI